MKSPKKRTPAKKPRQRKVQDDNTIVLDLGSGAGTDCISSGAGIDTITMTGATGTSYTMDPVWSTSSITIPNGGYTISSGSAYTTNWTQSYTGTVSIDTNGLTMKEGADIKIGGKSLVDAIEKIEERLAILKPNEELENRWEQLKSLRQQYIDLEKELLEKEKMWKILKEK